MPSEVWGSRLPVGSSASMISGRFTKARAIETRCCSPPESSSGKRSILRCSPTSSKMAGTCWRITWRGLPITSRAKATFSPTVFLGSSLKSWKMKPMLRRRYGTRHELMDPTSRPATNTRPCWATSSRFSSRMKVDLPDPDGPTKNTNSPLAMEMLASRTATTSPLYTFVTLSSLIMPVLC